MEEKEQVKKRAYLYQFKSKYMLKLTSYNAKNDIENRLRNNLVRTMVRLRVMGLPGFIAQLNNIINNENVSPELKAICKEMVDELKNIQENINE